MGDWSGNRSADTPATRLPLLSAMGLTGLVATACGGSATTPAAGPAATTGAATATSQAMIARRAGHGRADAAAARRHPTDDRDGQTPAAAPAQYKEAPQLAQQVRDGQAAGGRAAAAQESGCRPAGREGRQVRGTWARRPARRRGHGLADADDRLREPGPLGPRVDAGDPERRRVLHDRPRREGVHLQAARGHEAGSDGQPFSADDLVFYVEDVSKNKELTPSRGRTRRRSRKSINTPPRSSLPARTGSSCRRSRPPTVTPGRATRRTI